MSAHRDNEFDRLMTGYGNRELSSQDRRQLDQLAAGDSERSREVREVGVLHAILDREHQLMSEAMAPPEPREEADEVFQALNRRAARAEQELRATASERPCKVCMP